MKAPLNSPNENPKDRARLIIAVLISIVILFGFNHFVEKPRLEALKKQQEQQAQQALDEAANPELAAQKPAQKVTRTEALVEGARLPINGTRVKGSLSLTGARIDDLVLLEHTEQLHSADPVVLLAPSTTKEGFYFESGWVTSLAGAVLPDQNTVWSLAEGSPAEIVSGGAPVVLTWDNGQGYVFEKRIALDENFLFEVTERLTNNTGKDARLNTYHVVARNSLPRDFSGFFVLHEGPIGYLGGKEEKLDYKEMREGESFEQKDTSGWLGITDKYWMVTLLPEPDEKFNARITGSMDKDGEHYQTDIVSQAKTVPAGQSAEEKTYLYAGVKKIDVMHAYEDSHGFQQLDLGLDFGIWYFITQPFYYLLHMLFSATGSIAAAILLMTVIVRAFVFPLASKSFRSMAKMKVIAPQLKELQEKHKTDKAKLQMEIFELYKRENVNPFSGCWPILIQIPIFFALYKVILLSVELRHAPFWGWIHDLSAPDPTSIFNLFGLIPWDPPQFLMIGAWPLLFCLSMIVQKRLSPPMPDATQEKIQAAFPYIVTLMMAHFASGLVIYWTWSNVLGILQQYYILKKVGGEETSLIRGHAARRKKKE